MSASRSPTRAPAWASAIATLTLTVVLPTPPLPALTATVFLTPGISCRPGNPRAPEVTLLSQATDTEVTPVTGPSSAARMSLSIRSVSGQAGVVRTTRRETAPSSTRMSRTIWRLTMSRWSSGSITRLSACSMTSIVGDSAIADRV